MSIYILPDDDPIFRSQIHGVAFMDVVGLVEFVELLYDRIHPEIAKRMRVVFQDHHIPFIVGIDPPQPCIGAEELVIASRN